MTVRNIEACSAATELHLKKQAFFGLKLNCGLRQVTQAAKELQKEKNKL